METFHTRRHLSRDNITLTAQAITHHLHLTKTLQNRDSAAIIAISSFSRDLDPIAAYSKLTQLFPAPSTSPASVYPDSQSRLTALTHATFVARLKSLLHNIGVNASRYSGHSLCRGGCLLAYRAGVDKDLLQHHGTWRSDCHQPYITFSQDQQLSVTRAMGHMCNEV